MTDIQTILTMPDLAMSESGIFVRQIFEEYRRVSGEFPTFCDCQLNKYIKFLRVHYGIN